MKNTILRLIYVGAVAIETCFSFYQSSLNYSTMEIECKNIGRVSLKGWICFILVIFWGTFCHQYTWIVIFTKLITNYERTCCSDRRTMYNASKRLQAIRRQLLQMNEQYKNGVEDSGVSTAPDNCLLSPEGQVRRERERVLIDTFLS